MDNQYHNKLNEYIIHMNNIMYTFEVTKCCGYSTFITMYKNDTVMELYSKIMSHFELTSIKDLFFYSREGDNIKIPISKMSMSQFIKENAMCNPAKLMPIYSLPNPVVYRLYLDDGHCNTGHCSSVYCINNKT
jgi:hypothetical protein